MLMCGLESGDSAWSPPQIPHLKELGVNAVELLPVFEYDELEFQRRWAWRGWHVPARTCRSPREWGVLHVLQALLSGGLPGRPRSCRLVRAVAAAMPTPVLPPPFT